MSTFDKKTKSAILQYEAAKLEIKKLEEQVKELQPLIIPYIPKDKEIKLDHGILFLQQRPKWTFTPALESKRSQLKDMEKDEKRDGSASVEHIPTLYYKIDKIK